MRCTQLEGLSPEAEAFLEENCAIIPIKRCERCGHSIGGGRDMIIYDSETGKRVGMFNDGPNLWEYKLKDGSKIREVVQDVPWSSGPCIFLCLEDEQGNRIGEWPEENLNNC